MSKRNHSLGVASHPVKSLTTPTKEQSKMLEPISKMERLVNIAEDFLRQQRVLDSFRKQFDESGADYAFSWSSSAFVAAGYVWVGNYIKIRIALVRTSAQKSELNWTDEQVADAILDEMLTEVLNRARSPESSTSTPSNEMSLRRNAAMAEVVQRVMFNHF